MPVISTNIAANSAVRYLNINSQDQTSSLSKLASGSRISQASDDAAGLAISTRISSDVTTLNQAATNASHGISVLQTADGGAANITDILQRMKALATQSASGTVTDTERTYINAEFSQLSDEIDGIATSTRYNGQSLLDGTSAFANTGVSVMVGSNAADTINVKIETLTATALGLTADTDMAPDDLVGGSTGYTVTGTTTTTPATSATLTGAALSGYDASGGAVSFDVNGTTVTLSQTGGSNSDGNYSADDIAAAINSALGAVSGNTITASADSTTGALTLTDSNTGSTSSIQINNFTGGLAASDLGLTTTSATGTNASTSTSGSASFTVNGTTVTLSASGGSNSDGVYSAQDIASAINSALGSVSGNTVTASVGTDGKLALSNSATGSSSSITLDGFSGVTASDLGFTSTSSTGKNAGDSLSVATQDGASAALTALDEAINKVSQARAEIGATESRFSFRADSIATSIENLSSANSAIKDVDVASESAKLASAKVKTQAAVAAAAQASQMPQDLLKLLQ